MRLATLLLILAVVPVPLTAQQPADTRASSARSGDSAAQAQSAGGQPKTVETVDTAHPALGKAALDSLRDLAETFRTDPQGRGLPPADEITMGGRTILAGTTVQGPVATAGGPLHIYGTVTGDAFAIGSDVIVHQGGRITGNAIAALGRVALDGGIVDGEMRQLSGALGEIPEPVGAK